MWRWAQAGHLQPVNVGQPDAKRRTLRYRRSDLDGIIGGQS